MTKAEEAVVTYRKLNPLRKAEAKNGVKVAAIYQWSPYQKIEAIKEGISKTELENLKEQTELDYESLSKILAVTKATLHNKKGRERFDAFVSERILLLADVYSYGYEVFGNREKFNRWMKSPIPALNEKSPLSLADTLYGLEEIKNLIGRIAYGVFS